MVRRTEGTSVGVAAFSFIRGRWLMLIGLLLVPALIILMGWLPWQQLQQELKRNNESQQQQLRLSIQMLVQQTRLTADAIASDLRRDKRVLTLFAEAESDDPVRVKNVRDALYQQLAPLYGNLTALHVRQFHFHDRKGNSFLRLHQPERFGDPLAAVRPSIAYVIAHQTPVSVFEEGRLFNGYRNVYPLMLNGRYLGSVEISFSPSLMLTRIGAVFADARFYFLPYRPHSEQILFGDRESPYNRLSGLDDFVIDAQASSDETAMLQRFIRTNGQEVKQQLELEEGGLVHANGQTLLVQPVLNMNGERAAIILVQFPDSYADNLVASYYKQLLVGLLVVWLLVSGLVWMRRQRARVSAAFRQLSLALQGGDLQTWDYYPLEGHRVVFSGQNLITADGWGERRETVLPTWLAGLHPDDQAKVREQLKRQLQDEENELQFEFRARRQGDWHWFAAKGRAMETNAQGQVVRLSGVYRDISSEKHIREELEQSEQKYRALFAGNKAVELIIDPEDGRIIDANDSAHAFYHYPGRSLQGMSIQQINTLSPDQVATEMVLADKEQRSHFNFRHRLADGQVRDVEVYSGPVTLADGKRYLYSIVHDVTARKQAQRALRESKTRIDSLFNASIDGILMVNSRGQLEFWNRAASEVLGLEVELVRGKSLPWGYLSDSDIGWIKEQRRQTLKGAVISPKGRLREFCLTTYGQEPRWLEVSLSGFQQSKRWHFVAIIRDITDRKQQELALQQAHIAFENTMEGIVITDTSNRIVSINKAVELISGYSREELIGAEPSIFSSGSHDPEFYQAMWQALSENGHWQGEISNRRKDGQIYSEWLNINEVRDESQQVCNYVAVFSDISDLKASRERLDYLAHHDLLTGLPNRLVFRERLEQAIRRSRRSEKPAAVLFIDLDRFKHINDNLGHDVGDELLKEVAHILRQQVRDCDTVVRLGGDEFSILMEDFTDLDMLASRTGRMIDSLSRPIVTASGHELKVGASIGIAVYPQDAQDATSLVKHADIAMYRAKELGKGRYEFYNRQMTEAALQRFSLEAALEEALAAYDQIRVHYQPQIDLQTGEVFGLEALVRWQHPEQGMIGPDRFIPIAEENGMIHRIGRRVAEIALRDLMHLRNDHQFVGSVAINISALELEAPGFADQMLSLCKKYHQLDGVELEVTETGLGHHPEQFFAHLRKLRACGFKLAIDDFGTGHSTLIRLKQCPSDYLKIDRTFIQDLPEDLDDLVITKTILSLGQSLGQKVIAEGIETADQAELLRRLGCDIGQGYFFSRPLSYNQLVGYLENYAEGKQKASWLVV